MKFGMSIMKLYATIPSQLICSYTQ